jgi:hypothetical protein
MGSFHDSKIAHRSHEPTGKVLLASRRQNPTNSNCRQDAGSTLRFMGGLAAGESWLDCESFSLAVAVAGGLAFILLKG